MSTIEREHLAIEKYYAKRYEIYQRRFRGYRSYVAYILLACIMALISSMLRAQTLNSWLQGDHSAVLLLMAIKVLAIFFGLLMLKLLARLFGLKSKNSLLATLVTPLALIALGQVVISAVILSGVVHNLSVINNPFFNVSPMVALMWCMSIFSTLIYTYVIISSVMLLSFHYQSNAFFKLVLILILATISVYIAQRVFYYLFVMAILPAIASAILAIS